jgi:hypothetical protein
MSNSFRFRTLPLAVFILLGFWRAQAAPITWTSSGTFSSNAIELTQNVLYAVNVGSGSAVVDSATGVTFGADNEANLVESAAHGVSTGSGFLPTGTTGDTAFNTVLTSADFPSNFTDPIVYTLENLTIGQTYTVELLLADTRSGFNGRFFTASQSNGSTPSITQTYGFTGGSPAVGGDAFGTFTASATSEAFQVLNQDAPPPVGDGNADVGGQLNALIVVRDTPEPGSFFLVALAGAIAMLYRRKVRAA